LIAAEEATKEEGEGEVHLHHLHHLDLTEGWESPSTPIGGYCVIGQGCEARHLRSRLAATGGSFRWW